MEKMAEDYLLQLLAQNQIEPLLELLRKQSPVETALLEGQWQRWKADVIAGVLTQEQTRVEESRIRQQLLALIKGLPTDSAPLPQRRKGMRYALWGILGAGLTVVLLMIALPWFNQQIPAAEGKSPAPKEPSGASQPEVVSLTVTSKQMDLTAAYVGTTGYQILSAELSDKNPDHFLLHVRMRCVRPPYGQSISAVNLHLKHGEEEKEPYEVDFPLVAANATGEGDFKFEVPKSWKGGELVIYHGAIAPYTTAKIPLQF